MSENPFQSPIEDSTLSVDPKNVIGRVGFSLSLVGVIGLFLVGPLGPAITTVGMSVLWLCLPGLAVSVVGLFRAPRALALWGVVLGAYGLLYLPTFYLSITVLDRH